MSSPEPRGYDRFQRRRQRRDGRVHHTGPLMAVLSILTGALLVACCLLPRSVRTVAASSDRCAAARTAAASGAAAAAFNSQVLWLLAFSTAAITAGIGLSVVTGRER